MVSTQARTENKNQVKSQKQLIDTSRPVVVIAPGYHGHAIARSLGRLGVPVYGIHADRRSPAAKSRYWRQNFYWDISTTPAEKTIEWLLQLGQKIGNRPLLMPTDDHSCVFLADYATELKQEFDFPDMPPGLTRALSSKEQMYYLCKQHSIPVAETAFPRSREDVLKFLEHATFPMVLKGIDTIVLLRHAGVKMVTVNDADSLLKYYNEMETPESPNLMIQEYLPGTEAVWFFNGYFDHDSDCLFGLTARMIRQYPAYTGRTSLGVCITNETVAEQSKNFMKAVNYRGPLDIGYKLDARTGQYKTIDINPRIGATFRLLVDSLGMDVARAFYYDLTGQSFSVGAPREGRKWVVENFDLISSPRYCRDQKLNFFNWLGTYKGVEESSWLAWDDMAPFLAMGWSSMRWVAEKVFSKNAEQTRKI